MAKYGKISLIVKPSHETDIFSCKLPYDADILEVIFEDYEFEGNKQFYAFV
jgi:hypothetical protein